MEPLRATYHLEAEPGKADERAEALLLEQTVELPRGAVRDAFVEREILGRVEDLVPDPAGGVRARIAYPVAASALDPAQLLNLLSGNASLQPDVTLLDVDLPPSLRAALRGPRFGIAGLREAAAARDRPLTATALKPMGTGPEALGRLCAVFARAGVDVIKDDHGLADAPFCPFEARVEACQAALEGVARETGRRALYAPNLIGTPDAVLRQLTAAEARGVGAVLVSPMLVGLAAFWELCHVKASVPVLAHPALAGWARVAPAALLGTLFRAYGADAVIFPHFGGRFAYGPDLCAELAERLREPSDGFRPALPVAAGGIAVERVPDAAAFYGADAMLLIGGSLYLEGATEAALEARTRAFVEAVRAAGSSPR